MAKAKSRIEGMTRTRSVLRRAGDDVRSEVKKEVSGLARLTRDYARGYAAPVSSNVASAISDRVDKDGMGASVGILTRAARKRAWYAHFIEWGTRPSRKTKHPGLPKRPFLMPAWELAKSKFEPRIRSAVNKAIDRLAKSD